MDDDLQSLLNQLENNLNKATVKQCLEEYDCFMIDNNYPKTLELEELWELLHNKNDDKKSIYLIKKNYQMPIQLYCDEINIETVKNDDNIIFKYTMPYWWADFKKYISRMA